MAQHLVDTVKKIDDYKKLERAEKIDELRTEWMKDKAQPSVSAKSNDKDRNQVAVDNAAEKIDETDAVPTSTKSPSSDPGL